MPIISLANPKGGSGKSTAALVLALELARETSVAIVDADPNQVIQQWKQKRVGEGIKSPITVVARPNEGEMISTMKELQGSHSFVIVDLEGTASRLLTMSLSRSELVLVPLNPSPIDAELAAKAVQLIYQEGETLQREIAYRLVWSRYPNAVKTRSFKRIAAQIARNELPILEQGLVERAAYRDIFEEGKTLDELREKVVSRPVSTKSEVRSQVADLASIDSAISNANAFALGVVAALKNL
jgi:chromosome partitioning protein